VIGVFCTSCGVMHADAPPIVSPAALSVQQVRIIRNICQLRARGTDRDRQLGLVEICALLGVEWQRPRELALVPNVEEVGR